MITGLGKHVSWEKLKGKPNASMQEKSGFGVLAVLEVGLPMGISGDHGLRSSLVRAIDLQQDGHIVVTTMSSVYLVKILW